MKNNLFKSEFYLTDGGLETTLVFHQGIELNHFAAFELLNQESGREVLRQYYEAYLNIASKYALSFILETPTWRANPDWADKLGYSPEKLKIFNREAVMFLRNIAEEKYAHLPQTIISGNIGPRGDGYTPQNCMTPVQAQIYHTEQILAFALADVDLVSALTLNYSDEAIGVALAAKSFNIPVVISFTVETNGALPNGESLWDAIQKTDMATQEYVLHYMINCAHPEHFKQVLQEEGDWKRRIRGVRANASTKSHAELDESETLDVGDACALAQGYQELLVLLPDLRVIGGCCGTDHSHIEELCRVLFVQEKTNVSH